jgi:transcriptional regulator with XRE-family HTH domain
MSDLTPAQRFGQRVLAERKRRGWSQLRTAEAAGMAHGDGVFRAERGDEIGLSIAVRIGRVLGVSLDGLVTPPACGQCEDRPPRGFTCNTCGAGGRL